jgi:hypothetical protein
LKTGILAAAAAEMHFSLQKKSVTDGTSKSRTI